MTNDMIEVLRHLAEDVAVRDLRLDAIRGDRVADEAREIGSEHRDEHRDMRTFGE